MRLRYARLKARAESFCTKLNAGLMAVALVLAVVVLMVGTYRTFEFAATLPVATQAQWAAAASGGAAP